MGYGDELDRRHGTGRTGLRMAQKMLSRAFENGFSPDWVLADEVYGSDSKFRLFLEERGHRQQYGRCDALSQKASVCAL